MDIPSPSIPPTIRHATQIIAPIQTSAIDFQLCRWLSAISNPDFFSLIISLLLIENTANKGANLHWLFHAVYHYSAIKLIVTGAKKSPASFVQKDKGLRR